VVRDRDTQAVTVATIAAGAGNEIAGGVAVSGMDVFHGSRSGSLYCADTERQNHRWITTPGGGEMYSIPAVTQSAVIYSMGSGTIVAAERKTGKKKWSFDTQGNSVSSPIVVGDKVVCTVDGKVLVLGMADGARLWISKGLGGDVTAPAFIDGCIVVGTDDGMVIAFGPVTPTSAKGQ
jgi:outer membrane protein assembly factor BamB